MSAFDYVNAHSVAVNLIAKFGQSASVVKKGNASGFDGSGNILATTADTTIIGTVTPLLKYKQSEIDGESVLMGDSYVFFDSSVTPEIGMMITINSIQFRIINITTLTSVDDINVYRRLQLRK